MFNLYSTKYITELYELYYNEAILETKLIKVIPYENTFKYMDLFSLALLISDDGSANGNGVFIYTNGFEKDEIIKLKNILQHKLQIISSINSRNVMYLHAKSILNIKEKLKKHLEVSMLYKLGEEEYLTNEFKEKFLIKNYNSYFKINDTFVCMYCEQICKSYDIYYSHLRLVHYPNISVNCHVCANIIRLTVNNDHQERRHSLFLCFKCSKLYCSSNTLLNHNKCSHGGIKYYEKIDVSQKLANDTLNKLKAIKKKILEMNKNKFDFRLIQNYYFLNY